MALDSKGNQAIDFVWGNFPLQPDTERLDSAVEPSAALLGVDSALTGVYISTAPGLTTADLAPGDKVVISGTYTAWDGEYTVEYSQSGSPTGLLIGAPALSVSRPGLGYSGQPAVPAGALVTKSLSGNFGGGAGDTSWSRTTKKKSAKLDPALDSHNIATEFWNDFPGYTPNAGFVPQQVWQGTISGAYGNYVAQIADDVPTGNSDSYGEFAAGYVLTLYPEALTEAAADALLEAINTKALIGQAVPTLNFNDAYGNARTRQAGHIVGADASNAMYGQHSFTVQVAVNNYTPGNMEYIAPGTVITLGVGAPKTVLTEAVIGTDIASVNFYTEPYGDTAYVRVWGPGNSFSAMSDEIKALVGSPELYNAYLGANNVVDNEMDAYTVKYNFHKIQSAQTFTDMYGNNAGIDFRLVDQTNSWSYYNPASLYSTGSSIVVIK